MRLVARQRIKGVTTDEGLCALDGMKSFSADVDSADELIDLFEKENPDFIGCEYEIMKE